jgi:predicted NAD/FAD-dependent oxidoreductase
VLVIGAGAAGIGAARVLHRAGVAVELVEARNRIGGRTHSAAIAAPAADGTPRVMELGANWLQQGERNSLAAHAAALGLRVVPTDFHRPLELGAVPPGQDGARIAAIMQALGRRITAATAGADVPLAHVIAEFLRDPAPFDTASVRHAIDAEIVLDSGAPLERMSAASGLEPGIGAGDRWIVGGYARLLQGLLGEIRPRLGQPVRRIAWSNEAVHAALEDGSTLVADAAILTVPAAVLATGMPVFDPPLPERQRRALAGILTGRAEKVVLRFAERWWPVSPAGYLRLAGPVPGQISEWLDASETLGVPAITAIFAGEWAEAIWDGRNDAEVAAAVTRILWEATTCASRPTRS